MTISCHDRSFSSIDVGGLLFLSFIANVGGGSVISTYGDDDDDNATTPPLPSWTVVVAKDSKGEPLVVASIVDASVVVEDVDTDDSSMFGCGFCFWSR